MGMYNIVMGDGGEGVRGGILLAALEIDDVGRFRDAWVEKNENGEPVIAIYTRNGGGNRENYADVIASLQAHPLYLRDGDDDFDSTYATFYFRAPEELRDQLQQVAVEPVDMSEQWKAAIEALKNRGN